MKPVVHHFDGKSHLCGSKKVIKGGPNNVYIQCCNKDAYYGKHGRTRVTCKKCKKLLSRISK